MNSEKRKIVLTGGGTAGHVMPNLALLPYLTDFEVHYVGQPNSVEERLVKECGYKVIFHPLKCAKLVRGSIIKNLALPFRFIISIIKARRILKKIKPSVIFSKGGFVSLPLALASKKYPLVIHESDMSLGKANKMASKRACFTCTSFKDTADGISTAICTGAPLRGEIYKGNRLRVKVEGSSPLKKNLLVLGGSSGSVFINDAISQNLPKLLEKYNIVHIVGKNSALPEKRSGYLPLEFAGNIPDYFAWADLSITRGGANALFELVSLKIPSLVIPLPKGVSRGDQIDNAKYFHKAVGFKMLHQSEFSSDNFFSSLTDLTKNSSTIKQNCLREQNIDGTKKIAGLLRDLALSK